VKRNFIQGNNMRELSTPGQRRRLGGYLAATSFAAIGLLAGCEQTSKTVEVQKSGGGVDVKKTTTTSVPSGVDIKPTGKTTVEVETTKHKD
jgi:hypothetical protein